MKKFLSKTMSLFMTIIIIFTALNFSACTPSLVNHISFEYTLTDEDVQAALDEIKQLEEYIDAKENSKISKAVQRMYVELDYIQHQYNVGQIKYYSDMSNEDAHNMYVESQDAYMAVREECLRILKKLYQSDLDAKKTVFELWTVKELEALETSSEEIINLEKKQNELLREYLSLEDDKSEEWSYKVSEIYFEFVNTSNQLAAHYGYDNYYDYAADDVYMRTYSKEQREAFRKNIKEYVLPMFQGFDDLYSEKLKKLTNEQRALFDSLLKDPCTESNEYLTGYIESHSKEMKKVMNNLFELGAVVYAESENAYQIAYTDYSNVYNQPFVFFGKDCQNLITVVHELGHYAAFYHFTNAELPYDVAEVHSQGNEWLMLKYLEGKIDDDVYELFLLWMLIDALSGIIICTVVDEFEELVYAQDGLIKTCYDFEKVFMDVIGTYDGIEAIAPKSYIYIYSQYVTMEAPVYYLNYATSELVAMSFYTIANNEGYKKAQDIYVDLCLETQTGKSFFETLTNVKLLDPFDSEAVSSIMESFEMILNEEQLVDAAA